ncbi:MAG TPA: tetratricopeptide repeat protein, partial [Chryseolinea sp.]|nr:tetratricopeptide repeat protein [Chryseolinea sp.]
LKGIAWIALSHDLNTKAAKAITNELAARKHLPEAHLMLAEIAECDGDEKEKASQLKKFKSLVSSPQSKFMYHKYLATLEAEEFNNPAAAVAIAHEEIANRPTPQSYDLLAWGYYHQKNFREALSVAAGHVENQTFEPEAFYHLGMIYEANGNKEKARYYLTAALESEFELGPSTSRKIILTLRDL